MWKSSPRQILIFRPDNIGDVILFSGSLKFIRERFCNANITLAVKAHIRNLVENCPFVDRTVSLEELSFWKKMQLRGIRGAYGSRGVIRYVERLYNSIYSPYDLAIYPVRSPDMEHLEMLEGLKLKRIVGIVGCKVNEPPSGYPKHVDPKNFFDDYLDISCESPSKHEFLVTLDFLKLLGCGVEKIADIKPRFWLSEADRAFAEKVREMKGPVIGLFPGASRHVRRWVAEKYHALAQELENVGSFVIFGSREDTDMASSINTLLKARRADAEVLNLAGLTTLRQLYSCISSCSILISMESAGLHMGIASEIPTIGIVGGGHYGRFVPWGDPLKNMVFTSMLDCFGCNWTCKKVAKCIQDVDPREVAQSINALLAKHKISRE